MPAIGNEAPACAWTFLFTLTTTLLSESQEIPRAVEKVDKLRVEEQFSASNLVNTSGPRHIGVDIYEEHLAEVTLEHKDGLREPSTFTHADPPASSWRTLLRPIKGFPRLDSNQTPFTRSGEAWREALS